ncbi:TRP-domain-containing protein [Fistulina hepatica ATCC 64428]|uniref:TRP-domain-containing protein n=1 Tax=Fistulina hepatica ATCC 64428 TaxID=1128425 RepID=A0A0D7A029_9AGAR|nr:TRP-domain-containing protein [Fistulina hepatica ATCC 64428]
MPSVVASSVSYCQDPVFLFIQQFDVVYYNDNQSIFFDISAASIENNLNVTANLLLNIYGMTPLNVSVDLCTLFSGALCPFPTYNFTGSDTLSLPESLDISNNIPSIAFIVPDLEGFVQLILTETSTGDTKACIQATLSNGWSMHQPAVVWATGALAIVSLAASFVYSIHPASVVVYRVLDLLSLFQAIASSAFLHLNYPVVYISFCLNFAWAVGLFSSSSSIQHAIDNMRYRTGGQLANSTDSSAVALVNRGLSPYNAYVVPTSQEVFIESTASTLVVTEGQTANLSVLAATHASVMNKTALEHLSSLYEIQTVTSQSSNVLQAGIPIYTNSINIGTANAFMTVFIVVLIAFVVLLGVLGICYAVVFVMAYRPSPQQEQWRKHKAACLAWIYGWLLRFAFIVLFPIMVFAFYQWTLNDSWLSILLAVIAFLGIAASILYPAFLIMKRARSSRQMLYSEPLSILSLGVLCVPYREPRYYFFIPIISASVLKALFIAFAKTNGEVQIILLLAVEFLLLIAHLVLRPYRSRGGDVFSSYISVSRLVSVGLMIAFVERLDVKAIPRVVIGLVVAVIFSVAILITTINLAIHSGIFQMLWKQVRPQRSQRQLASSDKSPIDEKTMSPAGEEKAPEQAQAPEYPDVFAKSEAQIKSKPTPLEPDSSENSCFSSADMSPSSRRAGSHASTSSPLPLGSYRLSAESSSPLHDAS